VRKLAATSCLFGVLALSASSPYAQDGAEVTIKTALLYKFIKFVEWPAGAPTGATPSTIDICIVGDKDIFETASVLFKKASSASITYAPILESPKNVAGHCRVVFIGQGEAGAIRDILAQLKNKPVLTVSDAEDFITRGGIIGFVMANDTVKFEVNTKAAAAAGIRIEATMLETALRVLDK